MRGRGAWAGAAGRVLRAGALGLFASMECAWGQVGGIRGVVADVDVGVPLRNVQVLVDGGRGEARTDEQGRFVFDALPPGVYDLILSKPGYERRLLRDVAVAAGGFRDVRGQMQSEVIEMDTVLVEPPQEADGSAESLLALKQDSSSVLDSIGQEMFSKAGASTAADALKKISGASVQDDKYLVVRGLSDRYLTTVLNSGRIASADPEKRAINLDLFPTEIIESIDVAKTFSPEMEGESSGGSVNIRTLRFPDGFTFSLSTTFKMNKATGNGDFLSYADGGVPLWGFDSKRDLPSSPLPGQGQGQAIAVGGLDPGSETDREIAKNTEAATRELGGTFALEGKTPPLNQSYSAVLGDQILFLERPLGVIMGMSYDHEYSHIDDGHEGRFIFSAPRPTGAPLVPGDPGGTLDETKIRDYEKSSETVAVSGLFSLAFQPSENHEVSMMLLYAQNAEDEVKQTKPVRVPSSDPEAFLQRRTMEYTERSLNALQLSGEHNFEEFFDSKVDWVAGKTVSKQEEPDNRVLSQVIIPDPFEAFGPPFDEVENQIQAGSDNLFTTVPQPIARQWREFEDRSYNLRMNITIPLFPEKEGTHKLRAGIAWDNLHREYEQQRVGYAYGTGQRDLLGFPVGVYPYYQLPGDPEFGKVITDDLAGLQDPDNINSFGWFAFSAEDPYGVYEGDQLITAGYIMAELDVMEAVNVSVGARIELTDMRTVGKGPGADEDYDSLFGGRVGTIGQIDVLPALNVRVEAARNLNIRFGASRTVARPTFREFAPIVQYYFDDDVIFAGNTQLEMSDVQNYDVRAEWFPRAGDTFGAGLFYKRIENPIEYAVGGFTSQGTPIEQFRNFELARVYGIEIDFRKRLDDITGALGGWDFLKQMEVGGNIALIASSVAPLDIETYQGGFAPVPNGVPDKFENPSIQIENVGRTLQGQPTYTLNANIAYDNPDSGTFAGLFYNVVGEYLYKVGIGGVPDIYEQPAPQLDFTFRQKFFDNWKLTLRAKNLLDPAIERTIQYLGQKYVYDSYTRGRSYSLGLGFEW